jgi:S-formylglutathione hydrolase FrmB
MLPMAGGAGVPGEDDSWDFGTGAGFYVDATEDGWKENYKMYTYVTQELPEFVFKEFPIDATRVSITGHSMGVDTISISMLMWIRWPRSIDFIPA